MWECDGNVEKGRYTVDREPSYPVAPHSKSLLARGPKFAVVPRHPPKGEYVTLAEEVCQHLLLSWQEN